MWGLIAGVVSYPVFYAYSKKAMDYVGLESGFTRVLFILIAATMLSSVAGSAVSWIVDTPKERAEHKAFVQKTTTMTQEAAACINHSKSMACRKFNKTESAWSNNMLYGVDK